MFSRVEVVTAPIGWRTLQIKREFVGDRLVYAGAIDGKWVVQTLSRERTAQALLRKATVKLAS